MSEHIIPHHHSITAARRVERNGFLPRLIWLTGLSGSGKSSLANRLDTDLFERGLQSYILDGDNVRSGLNKDLDFEESGRRENIRRIGEVSRLFLDAGTIVITAFISPFREDRLAAKELVGTDNFIEVFVKCSLEECERRDVKGLYKKARAGVIPNFTGISSPFEAPSDPDIIVDTEALDLDRSAQHLIQGVLPKLELKNEKL